MGWAPVTNGSGQSSTGNTFTTGTFDTTGANFIVLGLASQLIGGTVSDSKGNTWNSLTLRNDGGAADRFFQLFYSENPTVGSGHTFTATAGSFFAPSLTMAAFSGGASSSSFDAENGGSQGFGTSISAGNVTPAGNNELLIAGIEYDDNTTASVDSGFTITDTVVAGGFGYSGNQLAYIIETTATAKNPTFTWTNNARGAAGIAAFKAAGVVVAGSTLGIIGLAASEW